MKTKIKSAKKANLHIHITGSLTPIDIRRLSTISKVPLKDYEPIENHLDFYDPAIWTVAKLVTCTEHGFLEAMKLIINREKNDNVSHLELTVNTDGMVRRNMSHSQIISTVDKASKHAHSMGITFKIKLGVNRKDGPKSIKGIRDLFIDFPKILVAGIDLNGDERKFPTSNFVKELRKLTKEGIPTTIHAGEYLGYTESLKDALSTNPTRVVHAVASDESRTLLKQIKSSGVVLEVSPMSSLHTGALKEDSPIPLLKFIEYDIPVVFGSDDPAIFKTNLSDNLEYLISRGMAINEVLELNKRAFNYCL